MNLIDTLLMMGQGSKQDPMISMVFMLGMLAVMYFFMIRPQVKKAKEQKEFSNTTDVGEMIVSIAGIHGKIVKSNDDGTITVEVDRNTLLKMEKSAISMEMTMALRKKNAAAVKA
jgi:preprotein translocase subunit YajC